jgi:hypothetical protein
MRLLPPPQLTQRRAIDNVLIHKPFRGSYAQLPKTFAHQLAGRSRVSLGLDQHVENLALASTARHRSIGLPPIRTNIIEVQLALRDRAPQAVTLADAVAKVKFSGLDLSYLSRRTT